ncbi:MAG TPA: response regulator transcription factor [Anaerolineales bacterium]|nr:response regulator transcription factor [Anaerolineales bacterium]
MPIKKIPIQRILLINNEPATGVLWVRSLQQQKIEVILEQDPSQAFDRWAKEIPDLIVIDVDIPIGQILYLVKSLRRESIMPILVLLNPMNEGEILDFYHEGADECIVKPVSRPLFIAKIKAWLRRSWNIPVETLEPFRVGKVQLHPSERTVQINGYKPVRLTNLELRIVLSLMTRAGRTFTAQELIQQIWGYSAEGDRATLKNLVYRLRRKIEDNPAQPRIIQTVGNAGYKLAAD